LPDAVTQRISLNPAPTRSWTTLGSVAVLGAAIVLGFSFSASELLPQRTLLILLGALLLVTLLAFPELALALYVVIGDVKGDDRVAALLPVDLTLALGAVLIVGILLNWLRGKRMVGMPPAYFMLAGLVVMMAASLAYTPVFDAGVEKLARFLTVTGIVIVAPFCVLGTAEAMKRFLAGFGFVALIICTYSLNSLGGSDRLVTPSSNTIGLGHIACGLAILVWFGVMPHLPFLKRIFFYPVLAIALVSLVGSGSRGAAVALCVAILMSLFFYRQLVVDLVSMTILAAIVIPFAHIPDASFSYLGTLVNSENLRALLHFRAELLDYGWNLLMQHPFFGVGIQGFRYYSPNAGLYNWPHNIFLEVCCEMGLAAGVLMLALFGSAIREALRQLADRTSPFLGISQIAAALLAVGIVNGTNTGDINSDRSTWLFLSLVFVVRGLRHPSPRIAQRSVSAVATAA
jgi:O-antigen ligase